MKILVQKFGGTSVANEDARQKAASKVIRAVQAGWHVVVVVSAIGRAGAPYATDTLIQTLKEVDLGVPPAPRELDMMMACGEIISTVVLAHTLRAAGLDSIALTGLQAGILTNYQFGNSLDQSSLHCGDAGPRQSGVGSGLSGRHRARGDHHSRAWWLRYHCSGSWGRPQATCRAG